MKQKFWMVWAGVSSAIPRVTQQTRAAAEAEAKRLAIQYPHDIFIVLESVCEFRAAVVQWEEHK